MDPRRALLVVSSLPLAALLGCEPGPIAREPVTLEGSTAGAVVLRERAPLEELEVLLELSPEAAGDVMELSLAVDVDVTAVQGGTEGQEQDRLQLRLSVEDGDVETAAVLPTGAASLVIEQELLPCERVPCRVSAQLDLELLGETPRVYALDWSASATVKTTASDAERAGLALTARALE